jgi:hypothetical protein
MHRHIIAFFAQCPHSVFPSSIRDNRTVNTTASFFHMTISLEGHIAGRLFYVRHPRFVAVAYATLVPFFLPYCFLQLRNSLLNFFVFGNQSHRFIFP